MQKNQLHTDEKFPSRVLRNPKQKVNSVEVASDHFENLMTKMYCINLNLMYT